MNLKKFTKFLIVIRVFFAILLIIFPMMFMSKHYLSIIAVIVNAILQIIFAYINILPYIHQLKYMKNNKSI